MEIEKSTNAAFEGISPDSNNYEGGINHIEIPPRTRKPDESLTEEEHAILRS